MSRRNVVAVAAVMFLWPAVLAAEENAQTARLIELYQAATAAAAEEDFVT